MLCVCWGWGRAATSDFGKTFEGYNMLRKGEEPGAKKDLTLIYALDAWLSTL